MKPNTERHDKRRNITRWRENRLCRLDCKIRNHEEGGSPYTPEITPEELVRCRARAHQLAHDIQYAWSKAAKLQQLKRNQ